MVILWDCGSQEPGSNPGPGPLSSDGARVSVVWTYSVESLDGLCRIVMYPSADELHIGGYGYRDVVVYRGAPVSFSALEKKLMEAGVEAKVTAEGKHLIVTVESGENCENVAQLIVDEISELLVSAERDLTRLEEVINESVKKYMEREM